MALLILVLFCLTSLIECQTSRPNIVLIVADDLGNEFIE